MGILGYGGHTEYELEDRLLAHLRVVIATKLRRHEAFFLTWTRAHAEGSGRVSLWVAPPVPLSFSFTDASRPQLNRLWVEQLLEESHAPWGLTVVPEPGAQAPRERQGR